MLISAFALLLGGCEQEKASQIEWQLPLEQPQDPHATRSVEAVPLWAEQPGDAELVWLDKSTARRFTTSVAVGDAAIEFNGWTVRLLGLASGLRVENSTLLNDENVDNPAAFVEISRNGEIRYSGWLYQKFPELFGMDDPVWKVWLKGITLRPAS